MASTRTTWIEILLPDGRKASLDAQGWRSDDTRLLARLKMEAAIDYQAEDPLLATARYACELVGAELGGRTRAPRTRSPISHLMSSLRRAFSDSALQRALLGAEALNHRLEGSQMRRLKANRLVALIVWLTVLAAMVASAIWLLR